MKAARLLNTSAQWVYVKDMFCVFSLGHREHSLLLLWIREDWRSSRKYQEIWTAVEALFVQEEMNLYERTSLKRCRCLFPAWLYCFQSSSCTVLCKCIVDYYILKASVFITDLSWIICNTWLWSCANNIQVHAGFSWNVNLHRSTIYRPPK